MQKTKQKQTTCSLSKEFIVCDLINILFRMLGCWTTRKQGCLQQKLESLIKDSRVYDSTIKDNRVLD